MHAPMGWESDQKSEECPECGDDAPVRGLYGSKYARYNFLRGYDWSLSFDALCRHLLAFWAGEDIDPESGLPHMAHAGWHCLTLLAFMQRHPELDDRPK